MKAWIINQKSRFKTKNRVIHFLFEFETRRLVVVSSTRGSSQTVVFLFFLFNTKPNFTWKKTKILNILSNQPQFCNPPPTMADSLIFPLLTLNIKNAEWKNSGFSPYRLLDYNEVMKPCRFTPIKVYRWYNECGPAWW